MDYNFEWDPHKANSNRNKHGISFEDAATIFRDPRMLSIYDSEHSEEEDRWITIGMSAQGRLLVVCHTFREETVESVTIRIISGRKATKNETKAYGE